MVKNDQKTHTEGHFFGYEEIDPKEKQARVHDVFASVAGDYDLMNDLMSVGVHRLWKNKLIRHIRPRQNQHYLDVAGGTGDIAFRLFKATEGQAPITVCDINGEMLKVGERRAIDQGILEGIDWVEGNAEKLPFADHMFDCYTISFGLRNVTHIDQAIAEAYRVLKPGGHFYCLEFSKMRIPIINKIYDKYSFKLIPKIGELVAKDRESYQYLVESIRQFPSQRQLLRRINDVGFQQTQYTNLSGGIAAIHQAIKI